MNRTILMWNMRVLEALRLSSLPDEALRAEAVARGFVPGHHERRDIERDMLRESVEAWLEMDYRLLERTYDENRP